MRLVDQYIGRSLLTHVATVLLVMLALYFFSALMSEMGMVGKGHYSALEAVSYCLMLLPRQAYELFPLVVLVGTIVGIGSLASSNELTVLRAAGVSIRRLGWAVMKTGFVLVLLMVVIGETLAPYMEQQAQARRLSALSESISINAKDGLWARDDEVIINISQLMPGGKARGISRYRFSGQALVELDFAQDGRYEENGWRVSQVQKSEFRDGKVFTRKLKEERWSTTLTPEVVNVATIAPENIALWELLDHVEYLRENGMETQRYETALWVRLFAPLSTGGMILLALPFVFSSLRAVSIGHRVMTGSMLGVGFYLVNGIFSRVGLIYDISPVISAGTPTMLVYLIWFYLMRRVH
jgi:lipopolysaccharide export system permease protein